MFSFIYHTDNKTKSVIKGIFPNFSLNQELCFNTMDFFLSCFHNISKESDIEINLRKVLKNVRAFAVYKASTYWKDGNDKTINLERGKFFWKMKPTVYNEFYSNFEELFLEPFSWWVAGFLRKLDGAIQDIDEFVSKTCKNEILKKINLSIISSLETFSDSLKENYPHTSKGFKDSQSVVYNDMYEAFKNTIDRMWEDVLIHRDPNKFYKLSLNSNESIDVTFEIGKKNCSVFDLRRALNSIYLNIGEDALKLKNIFSNLKREEFWSIISCFLKSVSKKKIIFSILKRSLWGFIPLAYF